MNKDENKNPVTSPVVDEQAQDILDDENVDYINLEFMDEEDLEYACEWAEDLAILDAEGFNDDEIDYFDYPGALDDILL